MRMPTGNSADRSPRIGGNGGRLALLRWEGTLASTGGDRVRRGGSRRLAPSQGGRRDQSDAPALHSRILVSAGVDFVVTNDTTREIDEQNGQGTPADPQGLWVALLAKWTELARASVALPEEGEAGRWCASLAPIINLQAVTRYRKGKPAMIEMSNGDSVPLSPSRKEEFMQYFV